MSARPLARALAPLLLAAATVGPVDAAPAGAMSKDGLRGARNDRGPSGDAGALVESPVR
jgi:hypothetical protein